MEPFEEARYWFTVRGAAEKLKVEPKVLQNWIDRGHLPVMRFGRRVIVHWDDVIEAHTRTIQRDRTGKAARRLGGES